MTDNPDIPDEPDYAAERANERLARRPATDRNGYVSTGYCSDPRERGYFQLAAEIARINAAFDWRR